MPNFFMTLGPNSGAGSMSTLYSIEVEIEYIVKAFKYFRDHNISYSNVKKEVMDAYNEKLQKEMAIGTVWLTGCHSWYITDEGKLFAIWPAPARKYAQLLSKFVPEDYDLKS